jgi:lipopolysaccharide export system protein LptA
MLFLTNKRRNCSSYKLFQLRRIATNHLLSLLILLFIGKISFAQQVIQPANTDTVRVIQIIQGKSLRQKTIDSGFVIETIAGNVILKEGLTIFSCDSAAINHHTNILEAFGNVHINQNDSINTYAQHLRYISADRIAWLDTDVKLTDKKGTLYTKTLKYDLKNNVGDYFNGGKVVTNTSVLTSDEGTYYADTKDVYFKNNVHLVDPKYDILSDSLLYNTGTQATTFITSTYIKSKNGGDIYTKEGTYDLKNGNAFFGKRTIIKDSSRIYIADNTAYDETSGTAQLEGNAVVKDSINGYTILGNQIFFNKKTSSFLATRKPVLIFKGDGNDSTFIAADTLFSGIQKKDSLQTEERDTIIKTTVVTTSSDTAIRYFLAFHHVRIFNDSLQSVCDSLSYSSDDSIFRLFQQPLVFANHSQISGDTIFLYTKNRKAERIHVYESAMIVNQPDSQLYNQMSGRTMNGYFKNGALNYMRVRGSPAESIYYPQNEDSAYIGMNRCKGDVIDIFFVNKEINKVKFINDVDGTLYPLYQVPADQKFLKGFKWWDERRPKNKLELFE